MVFSFPYPFPREEDLEWIRNNDPDPSDDYSILYVSSAWDFLHAEYDFIERQKCRMIAKDREHGRCLFVKRHAGKTEKHVLVKRYKDTHIGEESD